MKALLVKDIVQLLRAQRRVFLIIVVVGGSLCMTGQPAFALMYMAILGMVIGLSSLNYDDHNNGMAFLMTLPFSRRDYVREKYVFSLVCGVACVAFGACANVVSDMVKKTGALATPADMLSAVVPALSATMFATALMIPVRIKFGGEKSVVVQTIIFAVIFASVAVLPGVISRVTDVDVRARMAEALAHTAPATPAVIAIVTVCVILLVSEQISERIMMKKEW